MDPRPIYLDYNATTPIDPRVVDAMIPALRQTFGNPSSAHAYGVEAAEAVARGRRQLARLLGARPAEIVFTSGGSEANNMALFGAAARHADPAGHGDPAARADPADTASRGDGPGHVITSAVEHPAVLEPCRELERRGVALTVLPVDAAGRVDPEAVARALRPDTFLVSVMHAQNEVGTVQPIAEIAAITRARGVWLHTDAAQSVGKIPVDVEALGVDLLTVAGHKLYGPKGVGALYIRRGLRLPKRIHGAGHEAHRRAGTENVAGIVGLGHAAHVAAAQLAEDMRHSRALRDRLRAALEQRLGPLHVNGDPEDPEGSLPGVTRGGCPSPPPRASESRGDPSPHHRRCAPLQGKRPDRPLSRSASYAPPEPAQLPNTLSVSFPGVDASALLAAVAPRVAASAGAACHADGVSVSAVLQAMRVPERTAMGTVRLSVGRPTTEAEVDEAAAVLAEAVSRFAPA